MGKIKDVDTYYKIRPMGDEHYCVINPGEVKDVLNSWLDGMKAMPEYEG